MYGEHQRLLVVNYDCWQGRDSETAGWFHGVLHVTIHEAVDLPGDPTMLSARHATQSERSQ